MSHDRIVSRRSRAIARPLALVLCLAGAAGFAGETLADAVSDSQMADVYARGAQNGDEVAEFYLGALYASGTGMPQSDAEAFRWF